MPWTEEENERLRVMVKQGFSIVRAAAALKRPMIGVRTRARKLGAPFPPLRVARKSWTQTPSSVWRQP
jgi:hypothetical protein